MFTGIIKNIGKIVSIKNEGSNLHLTLQSELTKDLSIDQSVAHNGVCLTVVRIENDTYTVTAIDETLQKTNLSQWQEGQEVNLELAMLLGSRLDGHVVQGHVDGVGVCQNIENKDGSTIFTFSYPTQFAALIIEKGSICLNGVSLTAFNLHENHFQVAIIPYTFEHTGFHTMKIGDQVNVEFDILGKYFLRNAQINAAH